MDFKKSNGTLRRIGRKVVLPVSSIKNLIHDFLRNKDCDILVDYGAGTLYWTCWLSAFFKDSYAVDIIYDDVASEHGINKVNTIEKIDLNNKSGKKTFFACDVFHHLSKQEMTNILSYCINNFDFLIIKDIDCNKRIGNFFNKLHDKLINGESVHDVNPDILCDFLLSNGFEIKKYFLPKLWYPHFLILANKIKDE